MVPGWHQDPTGEPMWRWFDGERWTAAVVPRVNDVSPQGYPGPQIPDGPTPAPPPKPPSTPWLILVLVLVIGAGLIGSQVRHVTDAAPIAVPPTGPVSTTQNPEPQRPLSPCPVVDTTERAVHPDDGNFYGGRLSLVAAAVPYQVGPQVSWIPRTLTDARTYVTEYQDRGDWDYGFSLGEVLRSGAFVDPSSAATGVAQCLASETKFGERPAVRIDRVSSVSIDGRPGSLTDATVTPTAGKGAPTTIAIRVLVIDDGRTDRMSAVFVQADPTKASELAKIDTAFHALKVLA